MSAQRRALVVLVALHDVGKLSESFRALIRLGEAGAPRHWQLSDFLLCGALDKSLEQLGSDEVVRTEFYAAVVGYLGLPPDRAGGRRRERYKSRRAVGSGEEAARQWISALLGLFPDASLEGMGIDEAKTLSWAVSGLTVAADRVGSYADWFPVEFGSCEIVQELAKSRCRAGRALREAGLVTPEASRDGGDAGVAELRPMQEAARSLPLDVGPQLAIIEDATGTGKTEAALMLAHRMMVAGKARGFSFALPTRATSNAMFERMQRAAPGMFDAPPPVELAHSWAKLHAA